MPSRGLQDIARRRAELLVRSESLRMQFAASARTVRHPLSIADRARDAVHWVRGHPQVLLAAGAAFALARPRRVIGWSLKLWGAWRVWRQVMAAVRGG